VLSRAIRCVFLVLAACPGAETPEPASPDRPAAPEPPAVAKARPGSELVGEPARTFVDLAWLDGRTRTLAGLRGQVVLVRFWTDTCPYCRRTAPHLQQLDAEFRARGLVALGLYHPKPRGRAVTREEVAATVKEWALEFPVAIDAAWSTLDAWWLTTGERDATSSTFLLDRDGIIRWVHPGPEYSDAEYAELHATIATLLAQPS
jgi:peroxiredoxin